MSIKDPCKKKNLLEELKELLSHDDRLTVDGKLLKKKVDSRNQEIPNHDQTITQM